VRPTKTEALVFDACCACSHATNPPHIHVNILDRAVKFVYTGGMSESLDRYIKITEHRNQVAIHTMHLEVEVARAAADGHNLSELARWAGVSRPTIYKMIDRGVVHLAAMADPGRGA
jgi:hypothetical protein